jgi:3',5'-cyclic AMP phosphodiesterase CpdA
MLIAQITDLHVRPRGLPANRVVETNMMTERAIDAVIAVRPRPDVVLITGDLVDCGLVAEYEQFKIMLRRLDIPTFMIPGNHDRRENFRRVLADYRGVTEDPEFVQFVVDDYPVRLIALDTLVPGKGEGALCARRLAFLEGALARDAEKPTVIFMHHPPFDCGIEHMDRIRLLEGAERLGEIVRPYRNVERILCGHHHRSIETRFAGTIASISPGVAHQVTFDINEGAPASLVLEPPAYQLHRYRPQTGIVSHTVYVERYPGPFPFLLGDDYPGKC